MKRSLMFVVLLVVVSIHCATSARVNLISQVQKNVTTTTKSLPPTEDMETVNHEKLAGNGYAPGSPLYEKQQKLKKQADPDGNASTQTNEWYDDSEKVYETMTLSAKIGLLVTNLVIIFICALLYEKCHGRYKEIDEYALDPNPDGFNFSCYSLEHCFTCIGLCACCCLPIRWADTLSKEPNPAFFNFWVGLLIFASLCCLAELSFGICGLVVWALAVYYRQQLRSEYGIDRGMKSVVQDILMWCCCAPCAAAQEAKQVEFVKNHKGESPATCKQEHHMFEHHEMQPGDCPKCRGTGKLGVLGGHTGLGKQHPCPDCGGTGRIDSNLSSPMKVPGSSLSMKA